MKGCVICSLFLTGLGLQSQMPVQSKCSSFNCQSVQLIMIYVDNHLANTDAETMTEYEKRKHCLAVA